MSAMKHLIESICALYDEGMSPTRIAEFMDMPEDVDPRRSADDGLSKVPAASVNAPAGEIQDVVGRRMGQENV